MNATRNMILLYLQIYKAIIFTTAHQCLLPVLQESKPKNTGMFIRKKRLE